MEVKKIMYVLLFLLFMPRVINAQEYKVISEETKYFKTITTYSEYSLYGFNNNLSVTTEISEEEYNNAVIEDITTLGNGETETTYKMMTTSILANGSNYRYRNRLAWKNFPKVRSYDIIGIGFYPSVKLTGTPVFTQYYCPADSECITSTNNYIQTFSEGIGTSFKLPSGELTQLEQTFYFNVEKNVDATIIRQTAYGDYSHATKSISLTNSKKYSVGVSGIELNSSVEDYYDSINYATATWSGTW